MNIREPRGANCQCAQRSAAGTCLEGDKTTGFLPEMEVRI